MPIPQYQSYMRSVLASIADGSEHHIREITEFVCNEFSFTDEQRQLKISSGKSTYAHGRISWAKTYLVQAGLIVQPKRAHCIITSRGLQALQSKDDINNEYLKQFSEFTEFQQRSNKNESVQSSSPQAESSEQKTPLELIEHNVNVLNNNLSSDILQAILNASPQFFENLVVDLMLAMGYGGSRKDAGNAIHTRRWY